jgi:hypothetical protein
MVRSTQFCAAGCHIYGACQYALVKMLNKIAHTLPSSPLSKASSATEEYSKNHSPQACRELVELFQRIASTKQKDLPLDLPADFIHNLMVAKSIMKRQRADDFNRLLECVNCMIAILEVRCAAGFLILTLP